MIALLAVAVALGPSVAPVHRDKLTLVSYCDGYGQAMAVAENVSNRPVGFAWVKVVTSSAFGGFTSTGTAVVMPGQFFGWLVPADRLAVTVKSGRESLSTVVECGGSR